MYSAGSQHRRLSDLPIGALSHVSSYLTFPSRALLAVAINCRDMDWSAIAGEERDVLDFGDIKKDLAVKLTDDDVRNVLLAVNAVNNLKTLRLTNLLNITGIGLEPLRGSTTIEKIDLSLVGDHESHDLSPAPPISCTEVLPILDSIIDMGEECSLKLLIFPNEWRKERNVESEFHSFLVRYNQLFRSRGVTCLKCDGNLSNEITILQIRASEYGFQDDTCYGCMKHYCNKCFENEDGEGIKCMSAFCDICNRSYCLHCSREGFCMSCTEWFCMDCMDINYCAECDEETCLNCISTRRCHSIYCEGEIWCATCADDDALIPCDNCDTDYCVDCYENNIDEYCEFCADILDETDESEDEEEEDDFLEDF